MLRIDKKFLKRFMRFFTLNERNWMNIIASKDLLNKNNIEYWMNVLKFVELHLNRKFMSEKCVNVQYGNKSLKVLFKSNKQYIYLYDVKRIDIKYTLF
jgi:hypothetical protein